MRPLQKRVSPYFHPDDYQNRDNDSDAPLPAAQQREAATERPKDTTQAPATTDESDAEQQVFQSKPPNKAQPKTR